MGLCRRNADRGWIRAGDSGNRGRPPGADPTRYPAQYQLRSQFDRAAGPDSVPGRRVPDGAFCNTGPSDWPLAQNAAHKRHNAENNTDDDRELKQCLLETAAGAID